MQTFQITTSPRTIIGEGAVVAGIPIVLKGESVL